MQNFFSKYSLKVMGMLLIFYIGMILGALLCYWKGEASLTVLEESMWDILISIAVGIITSILFNLIMWFWQFHKIPENLRTQLNTELNARMNSIDTNCQTIQYSLNPNTSVLEMDHHDIRNDLGKQDEKINTICAEINEQKLWRQRNLGTDTEVMKLMVDSSYRERAVLQVSNQELEKKVCKLEVQIEQVETQKVTLQTEMERFQRENQTLRDQIKELQEEKEILEEQLRESQEEDMGMQY